MKRVYIVCTEDKAIPEEFQQWQIDNIGVTEARVIKSADHMAMLCEPEKLCATLLEIAHKYNWFYIVFLFHVNISTYHSMLRDLFNLNDS